MNKMVRVPLPPHAELCVNTDGFVSALFINTKQAGILIEKIALLPGFELTDKEKDTLKKIGARINDRYSD